MIVTLHAIERYRQHTGSKSSATRVAKKIEKFVAQGQPVQLKPRYRAAELLNHGCEEATFVQYDAYIIVLVEDRVKTIHRNSANRWEVAG